MDDETTLEFSQTLGIIPKANVSYLIAIELERGGGSEELIPNLLERVGSSMLVGHCLMH